MAEVRKDDPNDCCLTCSLSVMDEKTHLTCKKTYTRVPYNGYCEDYRDYILTAKEVNEMLSMLP